MHWSYGGWSAWFVMATTMVVFWGLLIWLIVPRFGGTERSSMGNPPLLPEDVLAQRFAAGEVDEQEYRTRLEALRSAKVGVH